MDLSPTSISNGDSPHFNDEQDPSNYNGDAMKNKNDQTYVHHDGAIRRPSHIPYDETFEKDFIRVIANPVDTPPPSTSVSTIPPCPPTLPIPLSHPSRQYKSPYPGVYLTHPQGSLWGGPSTSSRNAADVWKELQSRCGATTAPELQRAADAKKAETAERTRQRMKQYEANLKNNEEILRQIDMLTKERETERKVEQKILAEKAERMEARKARASIQ